MEQTTMNDYTRGEFGCPWSDVRGDCIFFSYVHSPDLKLMLVTYQGNNNGLGNRGRVYRADGSEYRGSGMCLSDPIFVYGLTLSVIYIGGE